MKGAGAPVPKLRAPFKRNKTGCFCCRLRRKKCDGRQPRCQGCEKHSLICSWPAANGDSTANKKSDFAWRLKFKAGHRVTQDAHVEVVAFSPDASQATESQYYSSRSSSLTYSTSPSSISAGSPGDEVSGYGSGYGHFKLRMAPSTENLISDQKTRYMYDFYVNKTSHVLIGRNCPANPYLHFVLPIAQEDALIMRALLALGALHAGAYNGSREQAIIAGHYYGLVLKDTKLLLTSWVSGARETTLRLLLATMLLAQYEVRLCQIGAANPPSLPNNGDR